MRRRHAAADFGAGGKSACVRTVGDRAAGDETGQLATATPPAAQGPAAGSGFFVAQIAAEADVEFFQACGASVPATVAEIEAILEACSAIFEAGPGITLEITSILVNTAEPDPYSTNNAQTLLSQFQSNWNANHPTIERDLVHLFTGKNLAGSIIGIAFFDSICDPNSAYSLSESKFTTDFETQVAITCQEIAHVFGASHCDGQPDCSVMCSAFGGCTGVMDAFGASTSNVILKTAQSGGCLEPPAPLPVLSTLSPSSGPALGAGTVRLNGTNLTDTISVDFGGADVPFVVVDDTAVDVEAPLADRARSGGRHADELRRFEQHRPVSPSASRARRPSTPLPRPLRVRRSLGRSARIRMTSTCSSIR